MESPAPIVILGAGTQAKVVGDLILTRGDYELAGFFEIGKDPKRVGTKILGAEVLATLAEIEAIVADRGIKYAAVAIGDNKERARLIDIARQARLELPALVHPSATISTNARLDAGTVVAAQAVVGVGAHIGEGGIVNTSASVDHDCILGRCVHVAVGCHLAGTVTVGDFVTFGAGSCAIPGVMVGNNVTVGAGAAVVNDLPDGSTAVGVPAKPR